MILTMCYIIFVLKTSTLVKFNVKTSFHICALSVPVPARSNTPCFTTISSKISSFFWIAFLDQKSTIFRPKMDHFWSPKTRFFKRKCWRKTWLFKTREVSKMTTLSNEITTFIKLAYWTSYVLCISFVKKMHKIWNQN